MSEINVQLKDGEAAQLSAPVTVAEALKRLDRDAAKQRWRLVSTGARSIWRTSWIIRRTATQ